MTENSNSGAKRAKKNVMERSAEFDPGAIRIVVGLGNPENAYKNTYHNVGVSAVDRLSDSDIETKWRKEDSFSYLKSGQTVFLKPNVFMNDSGLAVREGLRYFKVKPENLIICHDDSDIEIGKYKIAFGRGAAGHRGVASIINHLKTNGFWRARIGVRSRRGKAGDFILKNTNAAERAELNSVFDDLKLKLFPNRSD